MNPNVRPGSYQDRGELVDAIVSHDLQAEHRLWGSLIARIASGDQAAFAEFYDLTCDRVFGFLVKMLRDRPTAEEVALDVYTQAWQRAGTYDATRGTPMSWLFTLARSRAIDRLRARRAEGGRLEPIEAAESLAAESLNPEADSMQAERQRLVRDALACLPPEQREALNLAYFSGLSQSEVAAQLDIPLGTVKTRIRMGMMKLRDLLKGHGEGLMP